MEIWIFYNALHSKYNIKSCNACSFSIAALKLLPPRWTAERLSCCCCYGRRAHSLCTTRARGPDILRLPNLLFRQINSGNNFKAAIENYMRCMPLVYLHTIPTITCHGLRPVFIAKCFTWLFTNSRLLSVVTPSEIQFNIIIGNVIIWQLKKNNIHRSPSHHLK
jgi:hypothetical protein